MGPWDISAIFLLLDSGRILSSSELFLGVLVRLIAIIQRVVASEFSSYVIVPVVEARLSHRRKALNLENDS